MGTLFEGFQILCTDYDYVLGKRGDSKYSREDIIQVNAVTICLETDHQNLVVMHFKNW